MAPALHSIRPWSVYGQDLAADGLARLAERYGSQWGAWAHYLRVAA